MKQTINFGLFGISLILLGASLFLNVSHTVITNESIVLVFVGIIATFIVVGNYAQVTEIRNNTHSQIKDLELNTKYKIDELNKLYDKMTETSEKLKTVENRLAYNAAEAYRLYGAYCFNRKLYRNSCQYLLDAVSLFNKSTSNPKMDEKILSFVIRNLEPVNWNNFNQKQIDFDYQDYLRKVKELPDNYAQKQRIIDLLEIYNKEELENRK